MPAQIRIYTIHEGQMDQFITLWQEHIAPLRKSLGFEIPNAWISTQTNQFYWIMQYDGPKAWEELDQAYFDSPQRAAMQPDPKTLIARSETYFVEQIIK